MEEKSKDYRTMRKVGYYHRNGRGHESAIRALPLTWNLPLTPLSESQRTFGYLSHEMTIGAFMKGTRKDS